MKSPAAILYWIERNVKPMRLSRQKTLAEVVKAAMRLTGAGVLSLGRAMRGEVAAKHCIKRVWRFFGNKDIELDAIRRALAESLAPTNAPVVILLDWTEYGAYKTLVAALPRDGRAVPVWWKTIRKDCGEGAWIEVEKAALRGIRDLFPFRGDLILVADRGFGNTRWLSDIEKWGWRYVQRISGALYVENEAYYRTARELPVKRGSGSVDWGKILLTKENRFVTRLVTTWTARTAEPWYLVTNLDYIAQRIVRRYQRRMWIEEMFRDFKNRKWGLGFAGSELSEPWREDIRWGALALAYLFLMAYGAAAEKNGLAKAFIPNSIIREREINLARLGYYVIQTAMQSLNDALLALNELPP